MTGWKKIEGNTIPGDSSGDGGKTLTIDLDDATFDMGDCKATFVVIAEGGEDTEDDTAQRLAVALSQAVDLLEMVTLASLSPLAIQACVKSGREALEAYRGERK